MRLSRSSSSVVVRTAVLTSLMCAAILGVAFVLLYKVQKGIYRDRLIDDVKESVSHISIFTIGYFYSQNNWLHLEETQKQLNLTPNVLYSYTVNNKGEIDLGYRGLSSPDLGTKGQTWEPQLATDTVNIVQAPFEASPELASLFPQRVNPHDPVVLVGIPIYCMAIGEKCAQLRVAIIYESLSNSLARLQRGLLSILIILTVLVGVVIFYWTRRSLAPIRRLAMTIHEVALSDTAKRKEVYGELNSRLDKIDPRSETQETKMLRDSLRQFMASTERATKLESELQLTTSLSELAAQVAHDIRSPLTALNLICDDLGKLPETQRELLKRAVMRINDIANTLPGRSQRAILPENSDDKNFAAAEVGEPELMPSLIETLISEKRIQYRILPSVSIEVQFEANAYDAFAKIDASDLKRILSNLIDNGVEALNESGKVVISVAAEDRWVKIDVIDNGQGISSEVLPKLMQRGATFGKKSGSGLGLFHAKTIITQLGGGVEISSKLERGTTVTIHLPKAQVPAWFASRIPVSSRRQVVVVDDDPSIHGVWASKLEVARSEDGLKVDYLFSGQALGDWVTANANLIPQTLFLVDFEFVGDEKNGLDYISELKLAPNSILVTSRFEETRLKRFCTTRGILLMPKSLAMLIPLV